MENNLTIACKLSTPALQQRKETVIAELKKRVVERKESDNAVFYTFDSSDETLDLLNNFIKTERLCCPFFIFKLTVDGNDQRVTLELTGPEGSKDFVVHELGF